jgi:KDO2-lipid IV(A) lauroyltransferase
VRGRFRKTKRLLFHAAVRGLQLLATVLPRRAAMQVFSGIGAAVRRVDRPAVLRSLRHLELARVGGDARGRADIVDAMFRATGRNLVDLLRLPRTDPRELAAIVRFEGLHHLDAALDRGRGVVALSAHLGNWELLGAALTARGVPVTVVAQPLFDARSDRLLNRWRRDAGLRVVPRERGLLPVVRALRAGGVVGTLVDQDTGGPSLFADFFGTTARTPRAPFRLARKTGAALVPMWIHLDGDGVHRVEVRPPIEAVPAADPEAALQEDARRWHAILEQAIRRHPEQWVWHHRRWKTRPEGDTLDLREFSNDSSYRTRFQCSREAVETR